MRYAVFLTSNAQRNVRGILSYIKQSSRRGAETWRRRWMEVLDLLRTTAGGCSLAAESADHDIELRQIVFKTRHGLPYRAVFLVRNDECLILHVRGPGQDLIPPDEIGI